MNKFTILISKREIADTLSRTIRACLNQTKQMSINENFDCI